MANRQQILKGVAEFIDKSMLLKAEGNYRIILRTVKSGILISPDTFWTMIVNTPIGKLLDSDDVDIDTLEEILTEGLGNNELELQFKLLGSEYKIYLSADDVHKLKSCIERSDK